HSGGSIVEIGSHDELMRIQDGRYRMLVELQTRAETSLKGHSPKQSGGDTSSGSVVVGRSTLESRRSDHKISSQHHGDTETDTTVDATENLPQVSLARLWKLSFPEWKYMVFGGVGAIVNACMFPMQGVLVTKMTTLFFNLDQTKHEMIVDAGYWALGFVGLAVGFTVSVTMQHYGFGVASQKLVSRVRLAAFQAMLRQEVGWFDLDENSSGALVSRLATDSAILQAMTADTLNQRLVNLTTLAVAMSIAFYYSWQMTLALFATVPLFIFSARIRMQQMGGTISNRKANDADTAAGSILAEAIGSIRTVASFSMESALKNAYVGFLDESKQTDKKLGLIGGASFGFSQGVMFLNMSFLFWLGGKLVSKGTITFEDMFMVIMVVALSTFAVGLAAKNVTDSAKAKKAASRVFKIIDRVPAIDA
ncbi:Multidrug resistance protein abc superfamily, partial [Globisporangium polare]